MSVAAGGAVRVFRGGVDLISQVNAPVDGSDLGLRFLGAGGYVARDEQGGEVAFEVGAEGELAVVAVGEAGGGVTVVGPGGDVIDRVESPKAARKPAAAKKKAAKK